MTNGVPNRQIAEEAADWAVRLDAGFLSEAERRHLAQWLVASPVHVDELLYAASILGGMEMVDGAGRISVDALLAAHAPEVIPLFAQIPHPAASNDDVTKEGSAALHPIKPGFRPRWFAVAAALLLMIVSAAYLVPSWPGLWGSETAITYDTTRGEQRSVVLDDGSIVHMNTNSSLRVTLAGEERRIDLLKGEALFEVAHDPTRPFSVYTDHTVAQAVGTKFNVERDEKGVHVVVMEGKVLVGRQSDAQFQRSAAAAKAPKPGAGDVLVLAGYRADMQQDFASPRVSEADMSEVTLWRARQLSFEDEPLSEIAQEFNRYNRVQIVVTDKKLASARFSGEFRSNDTESFLAFLELTPGVHVDRSDPDQVVLSLRPQ